MGWWLFPWSVRFVALWFGLGVVHASWLAHVSSQQTLSESSMVLLGLLALFVNLMVDLFATPDRDDRSGQDDKKLHEED